MPSADQTVRTYRDLAEDYGRKGQAQMRDRFLVLAADAALAAGQEDEAERLRSRLLQHNPHHLLKPYSSFAEAMKSRDVQNYVGALRRNHPYEKVESLLQGMHKAPETRPATRQDQPEQREDLKVFRGLEANEGKATPSSSTPARPAVPNQPSQPPSPPRPVGAPDILPARRPYPSLDQLRAIVAPPSENPDPGPGRWVGSVLFVVLLLMGVALAAYTAVRPFLPKEWF